MNIVLCRCRLATVVVIVDPVSIVFVVVCRSFDEGDVIFDDVVCRGGVNLMLCCIVGRYSGCAFRFCDVILGGGVGGFWIPKKLSNVFVWVGG